ncbi:MAG: NAD(P)H-dependent oxidoreductase subunit E [Chloroflexi bacterium]|nr:NAD(P)H-dependent oxidoreductase subunit E [Chloroflexota bacterium]
MEPGALDAILQGREGRAEQLIEVLQDMQATYNYLPKEGLRRVADTLGVPPIEVFRVASFYKAFSLTPRGRHLLTVCTGTACHVRGAPRLLDTAEGELSISAGETSGDGAFTLERVNCLGCCALGPVVVLDGVYHDHTTPNKLRKLIAVTREGDGKGDHADA